VFRVEELLAYARAGRIRVPEFQRAFKWEREDVQKLLDSVWRGYPIGTLLLWSKTMPAGDLRLGELQFGVSQQPGWFVVDGQQRVVSLTSTLMPHGPRGARFDLYFDLDRQSIVPAPRTALPKHLLPLDQVVDSEDLLGWIDTHRSDLTGEQIRLAIRVGKAVREYEIPGYVVTIDDEQVVREIFERTNSTGKALEVAEVFNALHAPSGRQPATSLKDVVDRLRARLLGELDESLVLRCLLAIEGKDASGELQRQLVGVDVPRAVERTERALDRVFGFLAQDAGIPHLRMLPYKSPLTALSTYFDRFPEPSPRARRLLTRWLWRGSATGQLRGDGGGMRPALAALRDAGNAEDAARSVLRTVSARRSATTEHEPFNLRFARSLMSVIALVELRPRDLRTGAPIDVAAVLSRDEDLVRQIVGYRPAGLSADAAALYSSIGNRVIHPPIDEGSVLSILQGEAQAALPSIAAGAVSPATLASHAISPAALARLTHGDRLGFLRLRRDDIENATARLIDRHAEWDHADRVSLDVLIEERD
jgi:hypothetical protein